MSDSYRVKAPYVTLKVIGHDRVGIQGFYEGAIVSDSDVEKESLKRHLDMGMVEKFANPEPAPVEQSAPVEDDGVSKKPAQGDPKEAWVDYAVSRDFDRDEAEDMTKAELVDLLK